MHSSSDEVVSEGCSYDMRMNDLCADSAASARLGEAHQYGPGCCQGNAVLAYVPAPHTAQGSQVCQFARQQALESEGTLACYCGALPGLNLAVLLALHLLVAAMTATAC